MEAAEKRTKALQGGDTSSSNSQINPTRPSCGSSRQPSKSCYRCGHTNHIATACRFRESTCNRCHKKGHITINGKKTQMELDTGAAVSIISTKTKAKLFPEEPLVDSSLVLTTYSGEQLQVAGKMLVNVKYGRQQNQLPVYVVKGNGTSLLGRNWLQKITLNWKSINLTSVSDSQTTRSPRDNWKQKVEAILDTHKNVFKDGLGKINTFERAIETRGDSKVLQSLFSSFCFKSSHRKGIRQTGI